MLAISTAITAAIVAGCGGGGGGVHATFVQPFSIEQAFGVYQGVASITVRFIDPSGQTQIRHYKTPVAIEVGPPLQAPVAAQAELNPFHFRVNPVFPGIAEAGLHTILSAAVIFQGSELLLQHWRFVQNGHSFSGELSQPQNTLSPAGNLIFLPPDPSGGFPVPIAFPLVRETQLAGLMTADQISFRVEGNTADRTHPFVSEVNAIRVR